MTPSVSDEISRRKARAQDDAFVVDEILEASKNEAWDDSVKMFMVNLYLQD